MSASEERAKLPWSRRKKILMYLLGFVLLLLALLGIFVVRPLMAYRPAAVEEVVIQGRASSSGVEQLSVLSWNIGYAGLSKDDEFFADGGRRFRTRSRSTVQSNLEAISEVLRAHDATVVLVQEASSANFVTHGIDVSSGLQESLGGYSFSFAPTVNVQGVPFMGDLRIGQATFSKVAAVSSERHALASGTVGIGLTAQHHHALVTRLAGSPRWVFFNLHLAAFDKGDLRVGQVKQIIELAVQEYEAGSLVVLGGDWNLLLADTEFPYSESKSARFWVRAFPEGVVPSGWRFAVDKHKPTVRTLTQPYQKGVNYTAIIDGFLVSPNVEIVDVETIDLQFQHSDHNPVRAVLRPLAAN